MMLQQAVLLSLLSLTQAGYATRYWDCCKPSCSWAANAGAVSPMPSCTQANATIGDANVQSACSQAGASSAYTCFNNVPWAVDANNARGFAAVPSTSSDTCGKCYKLTFDGGGHYGSNVGATALAGKVMIVQASNTGTDVASGQFDIQIPGGGVGLFDACTAQWGASDLGATYGGFLTQCQGQVGYTSLPDLKSCMTNKCNSVFASNPAFAPLLAGCMFFVNWFQCADNPTMTTQEVTCPPELIAVSGMNRGAVAPSTNRPTPQPGICTTSGSCGCSWANAGACATNDGTACNIECCCPYRQTSGSTGAPTAGSVNTPTPAPTPASASCNLTAFAQALEAPCSCSLQTSSALPRCYSLSCGVFAAQPCQGVAKAFASCVLARNATGSLSEFNDSISGYSQFASLVASPCAPSSASELKFMAWLPLLLLLALR